jgi:hypothetical protein
MFHTSGFTTLKLLLAECLSSLSFVVVVRGSLVPIKIDFDVERV